MNDIFHVRLSARSVPTELILHGVVDRVEIRFGCVETRLVMFDSKKRVKGMMCRSEAHFREGTYLTIVLANVRRASLLFVAACLRMSVERR